MKPTPEQLQELEQFFANIEIPHTLKVNVATTQNDAPKFIRENIALLKKDEVSPTIVEMRYKLLTELKEAIEKPIE